jgi:hypothetical protein
MHYIVIKRIAVTAVIPPKPGHRFLVVLRVFFTEYIYDC